MSPWNKEALKAMKGELGKVPMKELGMLEKLEKPCIRSPANPSFGFLSQEQLQVVRSLLTDMDRMNKVIDYLREMEDIYFEYFCKILENNAFGLKTKLLRETAKVLKEDYGKCLYSTPLHVCTHVHCIDLCH